MRAAVIGVEILVNIEDQVSSCSVGVLDGQKSGTGAVGDEIRGVGVVVSGEENDLAGGTGIANGGNNSLDGRGPGRDVGNYEELAE